MRPLWIALHDTSSFHRRESNLTLDDNDNRSMRGPIWSDSGHLGLPDLVVSTVMDASNSHVDGRADKPSDSRLAVSLSYSYSYTNRYTVTATSHQGYL